MRAVPGLRTWVSLVFTVAVAALLWPASLGGHVTYVMVAGTSMEPDMHTGDLVLVREQSSYGPGDAVAFRVPDGEVGEGHVIIHRITGGNAREGFTTQGDNRDLPDTWRPTGEDVVGERWVLVPRLGSVVSSLRNPLPLALLAAVITFGVLAIPSRKGRHAAESSRA